VNIAEWDARNRQHADHPEPGDYWMEHLCPYYLVYSYDPVKDEVRYFDKTIHEEDGWYWDVTSRPRKSRAEFERLLHYPPPSTIVSFLCDVITGSMKSYVEEGLNLDAEKAPSILTPTLAFC
jgi:hypothetical protein